MKQTTEIRQDANTWWNSLSGWKQCVLLDKYQPIINGLLMTDEHKEQIYLKETASSNDSLEVQYFTQDLDDSNIADLNNWIKQDVLHGLVDENLGGIIGYLHYEHINGISEKLNNYNALKQSNKELIEALHCIINGDWSIDDAREILDRARQL